MPDGRDGGGLDPRGAAGAECGGWADAVRWGRAALRLTDDDHEAADTIRARLRIYEARRAPISSAEPGVP